MAGPDEVVVVPMALQFDENDAGNDVHEADAAVVGCNHGDGTGQEVDSGDLAPVRVVAVLVLHIDAAEQAEAQATCASLLHAEVLLLVDSLIRWHSVVVHEADAVGQADDELVASLVRLHGGDEDWRLLPVDDLAGGDVPDADRLIEAAGNDVILAVGPQEKCSAEDVLVLQNLNRLVLVDVPYDNS